MKIQEHLSMLGYVVEDKVSKFRGVATSISFDLYGCIQVVVHPGLDKDKKVRECSWFDINRLRIVSKRAMEPPDFDFGPVAEGKQGAAEKPPFQKT